MLLIIRGWIWKNFIEPHPPLARAGKKLAIFFKALSAPEDTTIRVKRLWGVILERVLIPFLVSGLFLMIIFAILVFTGGNEGAEFDGLHLLFFIPGFAIVSTYIVRQRWKEEVRRR